MLGKVNICPTDTLQQNIQLTGSNSFFTKTFAQYCTLSTVVLNYLYENKKVKQSVDSDWTLWHQQPMSLQSSVCRVLSETLTFPSSTCIDLLREVISFHLFNMCNSSMSLNVLAVASLCTIPSTPNALTLPLSSRVVMTELRLLLLIQLGILIKAMLLRCYPKKKKNYRM